MLVVPGETFSRPLAMPANPERSPVCPACGEPTPSGARFCAACGALLSSVADADRRVVTVLFADLTGFTSISERLDPEDVRSFVSACLDPVANAVAANHPEVKVYALLVDERPEEVTHFRRATEATVYAASSDMEKRPSSHSVNSSPRLSIG